MRVILFNFDCLIDFLKIKRSDLLEKKFKRIVISNKVYNTLSNPSIPYFIKEDLDSLIAKGFIKVEEISVKTDVSELYYEIINNPKLKVLGEGEASTLALAIKHNLLLAFNNPEIISDYLDKYNIKCLTTRDILNDLLADDKISHDEYNKILRDLKK